jgi:hypothetical protein
MTKRTLAQIQWIKPESGGRKKPPDGPSYSAVARFARQGSDWTKNAWSLVLEFVSAPDAELHQLARVRFLATEGPTAWLVVGEKFELLEGPRVVATGIIIPDKTKK